MASRTGWRSVGEVAITRRISARGGLLLQRLGQVGSPVRASAPEQPGVLDGDDGLVGERLQQRDLPVGEGRASAATTDRSDGLPSRGAAARSSETPVPEDRASSQESGNVGLAPGCRGRASSRRSRIADRRAVRCGGRGIASDSRRRETGARLVMRRPSGARPRRPGRHGIERHAQSRAALSAMAVEDRLDVGRRAGDDPQDLGRGRLLLQRLTQGARDLRI